MKYFKRPKIGGKKWRLRQKKHGVIWKVIGLKNHWMKSSTTIDYFGCLPRIPTFGIWTAPEG